HTLISTLSLHDALPIYLHIAHLPAKDPAEGCDNVSQSTVSYTTKPGSVWQRLTFNLNTGIFISGIHGKMSIYKRLDHDAETQHRSEEHTSELQSRSDLV